MKVDACLDMEGLSCLLGEYECMLVGEMTQERNKAGAVVVAMIGMGGSRGGDSWG